MISDGYEVDILTDLWSPFYTFSACTIEKKPLGDGVMPGAPPNGENQTRVDNPTYQDAALPTYSSVSGIPHTQNVFFISIYWDLQYLQVIPW